MRPEAAGPRCPPPCPRAEGLADRRVEASRDAVRQTRGLSGHGWPPNATVLDSEGMDVKVIQPMSVGQTRALQVLGAGLLAGVLGGLASHRVWMG